MRAREAAAVLVLALVLAAQLRSAARVDGLTSDEALYIPAGWQHLAHGDFVVNADQPPLATTLAAAGLLGAGVRDPGRAPGEALLPWCFRFLQKDNDPSRLVMRARTPIVALSVALALLAWAWVRRTHGAGPALIALALLSFHPTLLAHGHLATLDAACAFTIALALLLHERFWAVPGLGRAVACGVALGAALATKLTALLLGPAFLLLLALRAWRAQAGARRELQRPCALLALGLAIAVLPTIWVAYGLRAGTTDDFPRPGPKATAMEHVADGLGRAHVVPAAFAYGLRFQLAHAREGHRAYLLGEVSRTGWRHYYLVVLLAKSTVAMLLGLTAAAWLLLRRPPASATAREAEVAWAVVAVLLIAAVSLGHIDLGDRYLLPAHVLLVMLVAASTARLRATINARIATAVLLAAHAADATAARASGVSAISYFNALAGGPSGGHRVLLDSNLDWGQDLPRLAAWMRAHHVDRVRLAYAGADDPDRWIIAHDDSPGRHLYPAAAVPSAPARWLAISPDLLFGLARPDDLYAPLRERTPSARAGVFFLYEDAPVFTGPEREP